MTNIDGQRVVLLLLVLVVAFAAACSESDPSTDSETHWEDDPFNNGASPAECQTDQDCRDLIAASPDSRFAEDFKDVDQVYCHPNWGICTECESDQDCGPNAYCLSERTCQDYPSCTTSADCGSPTLHNACIDEHCKPCETDTDCDTDEICFVASHAGRPDPVCVSQTDVETSCLNDTCQNHCAPTSAGDGIECVAYINSEEFSAVSKDGSALPDEGKAVVLWVVGPASAPGAYRWGNGSYTSGGHAGFTLPDARPPSEALVRLDLAVGFVYLVDPDLEIPDGRLSSEQLADVQAQTLGATTKHAIVWKDAQATGLWWLSEFEDDDLSCATTIDAPAGQFHSGFAPMDCDDVVLQVGDDLQWASWR